MRPVRAATTIDAPREHLFGLVADLANRPAFCDHFQHEFRLLRLESRGVGAGARFRVDAPRMPVWMQTVIIELSPPHTLVEQGQGARLDRIPMHTVWELAAGPGATCDLSVTFWTEPTHPLDRLREKLGGGRYYRRNWRRALRRLKTLAETGDAIAPVGVAGLNMLARR
jgi:hypothetical protein